MNSLDTENILTRASLYQEASFLTAGQAQVDGLVSAFAEQASDWRAVAAMGTASLFYRFGRVGTLALASRAGQAAPLLQAASYGVGLASEVTAFQAVSEGLAPAAGAANRGSSTYWDRWRTSFVQFGLLKLGGGAAVGQNPLAQHLLQDTAMVAGHQVTARLGWTTRPEGGLAEQFLHAEATNLQLAAGMSLFHGAAPEFVSWERSLDLAIRTRGFDAGIPPSSGYEEMDGMRLAEGVAFGGKVLMSSRGERDLFVPSYAMSMGEGPLGGKAISGFREGDSSLEAARSSLPFVERTIPSSRPGEAEHPYRLFFDSFDCLLDALDKNRGEKRVIGEREINGEWVPLTVSLSQRFRGDASMGQMIVLDFQEGSRKGYAEINYQPGDSIVLHKVVTDTKINTRMLPGAGTVILDFFATQAALERVRLNMCRIENPQILRIVERSRLLDLDREKSWIEIFSFSGPIHHQGERRFSVTDPTLIPYLEETTYEHHTGMAIMYQLAINLTGTPHPQLLADLRQPVPPSRDP